MPVYNAKNYIAESLESLLSQSLKTFELIIVNDGSTDDTLIILNRYQTDKRIYVHNQSNQGIVSALNTGLRLAKGKYIARADADDYYCNARLNIQCRFLDLHPDVVILASNFYKLYHDGVKDLVELPTCHDSLCHELFIANRIMHGSVMIRKDALLRVDGYSKSWKYLEDYELWFRLARIGHIASIPEPLSTLRVHEKSVSTKHEKEQIRMGLALRMTLLQSRQYPLRYARYLAKPILKSITPHFVLGSYRRIFHKRR